MGARSRRLSAGSCRGAQPAGRAGDCAGLAPVECVTCAGTGMVPTNGETVDDCRDCAGLGVRYGD